MAPTGHWVICSSKAEAKWDFFLLWPFSVSHHLPKISCKVCSFSAAMVCKTFLLYSLGICDLVHAVCMRLPIVHNVYLQYKTKTCIMLAIMRYPYSLLQVLSWTYSIYLLKFNGKNGEYQRQMIRVLKSYCLLGCHETGTS